MAAEQQDRRDDGGAAFPTHDGYQTQVSEDGRTTLQLPILQHNGMSLRDWLAGKAMQSLLARELDGEWVTRGANVVADAWGIRPDDGDAGRADDEPTGDEVDAVA